MKTVALLLTGLVAFIHLYILWLEMFAWTTKGPQTFKGFTPDHFEKTRSMAANQGLYNGFLAAGLVWSFFISDVAWQANIASFFLGCVIVAGLYGAFTVQRSILFIQSAPAALALLFVQLAR